jgi:hypothetical protein
MKTVFEMTAGEIIAQMNPCEKDALYRALWSDFVQVDVEAHLASDFPDFNAVLNDDTDEKDAFIMEVVNDYVYNGKYDCNLSYWDNISNLIQSHMPTE